ncbi:MAG: recombinase family protein [Polynucleobacter sp.]|jgi:DNA invertase Pin-like site-specific DNA recombinase|nr:recombinase family protein [Polynucleobacter sp.]
MKRVVIYARVSTDKQQTSNQVLVLKEIAERAGYNIIQIYEDKGISGSKGREDRPALNQMMKDATHRKFDMVMCWSIDRLGRSISHLIEIMNELNGLKIDMFFSQQSIDTTQSSGRILFSIMGAIGEFEKSLIKERVLAGLDRARKNGIKLGRPSNMTDGLKSAILILKDKGLGVRETCRKLGIGCATYYKVIGEG